MPKILTVVVETGIGAFAAKLQLELSIHSPRGEMQTRKQKEALVEDNTMRKKLLVVVVAIVVGFVAV